MKTWRCKLFGCKWRETTYVSNLDVDVVKCINCGRLVLKCLRCGRLKCKCGEA